VSHDRIFCGRAKKRKRRVLKIEKGNGEGEKCFLKVGLAGKFRLSGTTVIPKIQKGRKRCFVLLVRVREG